MFSDIKNTDQRSFKFPSHPFSEEHLQVEDGMLDSSICQRIGQFYLLENIGLMMANVGDFSYTCYTDSCQNSANRRRRPSTNFMANYTQHPVLQRRS